MFKMKKMTPKRIEDLYNKIRRRNIGGGHISSLLSPYSLSVVEICYLIEAGCRPIDMFGGKPDKEYIKEVCEHLADCLQLGQTKTDIPTYIRLTDEIMSRLQPPKVNHGQ